jgi:cytochrome c-type biogenesis protein CcsB
MVDTTLAQLSNVSVYSAMLVYTLALLAFAVDLSSLGSDRRRTATGTATASGSAAAEQAAAVQDGAARTDGGSGGGSGGGVATAVEAAAPAAPRRRFAGIALSLTWLAFGLHLAGVVTRGLSVHRPPWGNMYEFAVAGALVCTGVYLAVGRRHDIRYLGAFVVGPVLLTLGLAVAVLYTRAAQLVPALHSFWLGIHVSVAFISSALFTLGFSTSVLQLVQERREEQRAQGRPPVRGRWMNGIPASAELERSAYRLHAVAFPLWTFTVIAGAIWAEHAWGRYWNWDPKEVWSFVIWVVYAGYLHARATRGWDGRRAAYLACAGYACILFNFGVVNVFFVGLHSYSGI